MEQENISCTPPEIRAAAADAVNKLLPAKSKSIYDKEYNTFDSWCLKMCVKTISENVLLAYYDEMSKTKKSSTLWASYSMLRACLNVYKNVDISKFARLQGFLKQQSIGYQPKKSNILQSSEIDRFIQEADNLPYLAIKVMLIIGYVGACRRDELINMTIDDVKFRDEIIIVNISKTKKQSPRMFVISELQWIHLIQKYLNLRPVTATTKRFFLTCRNGRCLSSPIGINKIGQVPKSIAIYLKLANPECYTGHCFRRSSASHLANKGENLVTIKNYGGSRGIY
ncbi:hypothetical protein RN001_005638 [Aquatica leii]|uniref:Tyr recombinase domain-containing protein n=1 Tax=Aquatica leii TaxID=1421715 RepID=A0AAN7Q0K9_9COLE|nr:hypothetical protein RN001_005638 [Aquatica leii]